MSDANAYFEAAILAGFPRLPGVLPATYRPKAGGEVATYAKIEDRAVAVERGIRGEYAMIRLPARDVPAPGVDDLIEVDGQTWQHRPGPAGDTLCRRSGPFVLLACRRELHPTLAGGGK